MRIVDIKKDISDATEALRQAVDLPSRFQDSCYDLTSEELIAIIGQFNELSGLIVQLTSLALDTLVAEEADE